MPPLINLETCIGCYRCVDICPDDVLMEPSAGEKSPVLLYPEECWHCGSCMMDCPTNSIKIILPFPLRVGALKEVC